MENFNTTRRQWRKGGKKEAGEIYVLIHFCGTSSFLMVLTRRAWTGMRGNFNSESEGKKLCTDICGYP